VTLSVVAKVKDSAESCSSRIKSSVPTAIIHTGANQFVRVAYRPSQWFHRITVHDSSGDNCTAILYHRVPHHYKLG
jgi:hypothetical protein